MNLYNYKLFIISLSPWPLIFSLSLIILALNLIRFFWKIKFLIFFLSYILILLIIYFWFIDVIIERNKIGFHNFYIIFFTINRIIIFIISEVFFFIRFFWTFFYSIFSPDIFIGSVWPVTGIIRIDYLRLPILNSLFLISRGCSITWRHYKILSNNLISCKNRIIITLILGILFIICQFIEYKICSFCFSDRIYGSIFFIATGFHGIHVTIGILFIFFILLRINKIHFSYFHLLGFEFSIWYWHFVDIVWLYLYIIVYWLGS
jgi:cytochrome c oxidase subunit 3